MRDPSYVVINNEDQPESHRQVLRVPAQEVQFPLSKEDQEIVDTLEAKYDNEENCAGLAAPQIGYGKQIIIFEAPDDPQLRKWRADLHQFIPKTIWINPSYEGIGEDKTEDYEGCFSVHDLAGSVQRFKKIKYQAYLPDGTKVEGEAEGFLARMIQHEVDHINGRLFIDLVPDDKLFSIEKYRKQRAEKMKQAEEGEGD